MYFYIYNTSMCIFGGSKHHCLVMDRDTHEVRGVISVSDIARELRLPLDIQGRPTFAELITILAA